MLQWRWHCLIIVCQLWCNLMLLKCCIQRMRATFPSLWEENFAGVIVSNHSNVHKIAHFKNAWKENLSWRTCCRSWWTKTRIFFLGLQQAARNGELLVGSEDIGKTLQHNGEGILNNHFLYLGQLIAHSILQGGCGPQFFTPSVADFLLKGPASAAPSLTEVPDAAIRTKLEEVNQTYFKI